VRCGFRFVTKYFIIHVRLVPTDQSTLEFQFMNSVPIHFLITSWKSCCWPPASNDEQKAKCPQTRQCLHGVGASWVLIPHLLRGCKTTIYVRRASMVGTNDTPAPSIVKNHRRLMVYVQLHCRSRRKCVRGLGRATEPCGPRGWSLEYLVDRRAVLHDGVSNTVQILTYFSSRCQRNFVSMRDMTMNLGAL
jgi:hypothetical protein